LWEGRHGHFLSNLAIYHAAMRSIGTVHRSETALRLCKETRETAFSSFMKNDHFISRKGTDELWTEIAAADVPFALVSPGDLALLAALKRLEDAGFEGIPPR